jgi:hypothetical protein
MPQRPSRLAPVLLLFLQSACEGPGDPSRTLTPEPGRPVFDAEVRPDPQAGTIEARWRISFLPDPAAETPVAFVLARGLEVERLQGEGILGWEERDSPFVPVWKEVVLELEEGREGRPVELELAYAGTPVLPENRINQIAPDWVELSVDSGWHPLFTGFDQELRGILRVHLPEDWRVVGGGPVELQDDHHEIRATVPQLDVAFVAAPGLEEVRGERISVLHQGSDPALVEAVLEIGASCAEYLDRRYGARDPLPHTSLVLADRPSNAYARLGFIVLARPNPEDSPGLSRFLCHELAHFWSRGADFTTAHHWMSEAFAEYVGARYVRERFGEGEFRELLARWEEVSRGQGPVWTEEMTARGSDLLMYRKAPVLLSRLEDRIGTEGFDAFLERYMTEEVRTTQELLGHLEAAAGPEAAAWFRERLAEGPEG